VRATPSKFREYWTSSLARWETPSNVGYAEQRGVGLARLRGGPRAGVKDIGKAVAATHTCCSRTVPPYNTALGDPDAKVGITLNWAFAPRTTHELDLAAARRADGISIDFLDPVFKGHYPRHARSLQGDLPGFSVVQDGDMDVIAQPLDFLGVNYYFPAHHGLDAVKEAEPPLRGSIGEQFPTTVLLGDPARTLRRWDGSSTLGLTDYSSGEEDTRSCRLHHGDWRGLR